jgi:sarcosine oxidase subunit gamma
MSEQNISSEYNYAETVNSMNLLPAIDSGIIGHSPLEHADFSSVAAAQTELQSSIELTEMKLFGHIVIRGKPENLAFAEAVESVLGLALPKCLSVNRKETVSIRWISPDEWLVIVPAEQSYQIEHALVAKMQGHCAVVNVSGGQTLLRLQGKDVTKLLQKSMPIDVHDRSFPIGKVVTSVFAKTQAVLSRTGDQEWELVIRRSFADYVWLWIQDSCAEFDLIIRQ